MRVCALRLRIRGPERMIGSRHQAPIRTLCSRSSRPGVRPVASDGRLRGVLVNPDSLELIPAVHGVLPWFFPRRAGRCLMPTMIQIRAKRTSDSKSSAPTRTALTEHSHTGIPRGGEVEPPEEAFQLCEAPEQRQPFQAEAPDAGDGRNYYEDREFKHGRSRG
jgi:hypothetical protein